MNSNARATTLIVVWAMLMACLVAYTAAHAQVISYEPGSEPPAGTFDPPAEARPAIPLPVPPVNVRCTGTIPAPVLQPAHNGRYTALSGAGVQIDYRQDENGAATVTVLDTDGHWYTTTLDPVQGIAYAPLYDAQGAEVGEIKLCSTTIGAPCSRLIARARVGQRLLFPADPNVGCNPGLPSNPGVGPFCVVQIFGARLGEASPEFCEP